MAEREKKVYETRELTIQDLLAGAVDNIDEGKNIAIQGHTLPDGDCVGSCLAIAEFLRVKYPKCKVDVYLETFNEAFSILSGSRNVIHLERGKKMDSSPVYDLCIACDAGDMKRLGAAEALFLRAKHTICIDHHETNTGYAEHNYLRPGLSSCAEAICELLEGETLWPEIASCLYLGLIHDTKQFSSHETSGDTMRYAGRLLEYKIPKSDIIQTYLGKTHAKLKLIGKLLSGAEWYCDGKLIVGTITREDCLAYHSTEADRSGMISTLMECNGVEMAVFFYERANGWKISLRSVNGHDVSGIAQCFGGGGHVSAAGIEFSEVSKSDIWEKLCPKCMEVLSSTID